jgi:uncharacterized linocin/CFP29 family protein
MSDLIWTEDQWHRINSAVNESFTKASVASAFLPMFGPLSGGTEVVRNERVIEKDNNTIAIDKSHESVNRKLVNLTVKVELSSEQIADDSMANAMLAFQRAGSILALEKDRVVFTGYKRGFTEENSAYITNREIEPQEGLADLITRKRDFDQALLPASDPVNNQLGQEVVSAVVRAMTRLEESSNPGPFACILGNRLFEAVHDPSASLVLPADRVSPILRGGQLLRSGKVDSGTGLLVSLAGNAIDIVIGKPPTVQFLQRTEEAKYLFRVYLRFALRIRDGDSPPVAGFRFITQQTADEEQQRYDVIT